MTLQKYIKTVGAIILLFCILPYCASAQNTEKAHKWLFWQKKERVENIGKVGPGEQPEPVEQSEGKFWDKLKVWEKINFNIFKKGKDEGMTEGQMVADSTKTKEYREAMRKLKKENSHKHQYSVGTNLLNWAYFGTANLEFNASLNNHFSVFAGGKYNGFKFETKAYKEIFNNQITGYAGIKWWPWFVNTGWWVGIKGQYSDFSTAGIMSSYMKEGVAVGGGLSGGYTFMMGRRFNLDLGIGVWGGTYLEYSDYEKPESSKPGMFVKLDNIIVSFTYFF